jgi:hypothetical protein
MARELPLDKGNSPADGANRPASGGTR